MGRILKEKDVEAAVKGGSVYAAGGGGWADHSATLPDGLWRDELTETLHEGGDVLCTDLFAGLPVALLRKVHI